MIVLDTHALIWADFGLSSLRVNVATLVTADEAILAWEGPRNEWMLAFRA